MNLPEPDDGMLLSLFVVAADIQRSARFYSEIFGGTLVKDGDPSMIQLSNSWIIISGPGGATPDKPGVTLTVPEDPARTDAFLNLRVADIETSVATWRQRGAEFLTAPIDKGDEIRCYLRDPDGRLIEVGQSVVR